MALTATRRDRTDRHRRIVRPLDSPPPGRALARVCPLTLAGLLVAAVPAAPAQAAQLGSRGAPGVVKSVALAPLAGEDAITVRAMDDTALNGDLAIRIAAAITASGRIVTADAPLRLDFRSEVIRGTFETADGTLGAFEGNTWDGARVVLNLWSSSRDSLLGGPRAEAVRGASVFHIRATLRDARSGRVVWRGDAFCVLPSPDIDKVAAASVAPLVASLGRTIAGEPFEID